MDVATIQRDARPNNDDGPTTTAFSTNSPLNHGFATAGPIRLQVGGYRGDEPRNSTEILCKTCTELTRGISVLCGTAPRLSAANMTVILECLNLIPVSYVTPALAVFSAIWKAVIAVQERKAQFVILAETAATLIITLDKQYRANKLSPGSTAETLDEMERLLKSIQTFVEKEQSAGFLKVLIDADQRKTAIDYFLKRIDNIARRFQISALIDVVHWQSKVEKARKEDTEDLHKRLDRLLMNQQEIMGVLVKDNQNISVVMATLMRLLEKKKGDPEELNFYKVSVQNLQRVSGKQVELHPWTITALEVEFGEIIGAGGFGQVFRGRWNQTEVALKVMQNIESTPPSPEVINNEVKMWSNLRHPHILQFLGANILDSRPFIVMPLIKNGNAQEYILRNPNCNRLELIHHVSLGLTHLHAHNVIHGDLKAVNILIDDGPRALLSDFGLSKIKANSNSRLTKAVATPQGSLYWMAPELFQGKRMKPPCDIYAFAMTTFELVIGEIPWGDVQPPTLAKELVLKGTRPERPEDHEAPHLTNEIWELIDICWKHDPAQRPLAPSVSGTLETIRTNSRPLLNMGYASSPISETKPFHPSDSAESNTHTLVGGEQLETFTPLVPGHRIARSLPAIPAHRPQIVPHPRTALAAANFTLPVPSYKNCVHLPLASRVSCLAQSPRGLTLAVGHSTGDLTLWHVEDGSYVQSYRTTNRSPITCVAFRPNANDFEKIVVGTKSGAVMVREFLTGDLLAAFEMKNPVVCVCMTDDDIQAVDNEALFASRSGRLRRQVLEKPLRQFKDSWTRCLFSPDGNTAWVGFTEGDITSVNIDIGQPGISFMSAKASSGVTSRNNMSHVSPSSCVNIVLSPNGNKLAACYASGEIRIWDIFTGGSQVLRLQAFSYMGSRDQLSSPICFSRGGSRILYPSLEREKTLVLQNVESGEILQMIPLPGCPDGAISFLAISPGERYITVKIDDSAISIFSLIV